MTTDRMERIREKAREVQKTTNELYGGGGRYAAEAYVAGARRVLTLTDAEWAEMVEDTAEEIWTAQKWVSAKSITFRAWIDINPEEAYYFVAPAEAAMRALGFKREGWG